MRANAANLAARVSAKSPEGEVYFTEKVMNELHSREARVETVGAVPLKGVAGEVNLYRLTEWLGKIEAAPNPFIWRTGITKAEDFFDRDREQSTLHAYLHGKQNCQIVGPRRIGKTSLLRQIERAASDWDSKTSAAYIDLQDPRCFTLADWLGHVSTQFGWAAPASTLLEFAEGVEAMLSKGRHPILCLDEFEQMTLRPAEFDRDFFSGLRSCGQKGMSLITASKRPLSELTRGDDPSSSFYNIFSVVNPAGFADKDAEDFVNLHRPGVPAFTPQEKKKILKFAKGHPLALQVACFHVIEAKENSDGLTAALQRAAHDMKAHLPDEW